MLNAIPVPQRSTHYERAARTCFSSFAAAILAISLIGCSFYMPLPRHDDEVMHEPQHEPPMDSTFAAALSCERAYVHAHIQAEATATEISDAAVEACGPQITAAVDAYVFDVVARLATAHQYMTDTQGEQERTRMRADITASLRKDGLRLTVEGRTPPLSK